MTAPKNHVYMAKAKAQSKAEDFRKLLIARDVKIEQLEMEVTMLLSDLRDINKKIYAAGAQLGSDNYFFIRTICADAAKRGGIKK